MGAPPFTVAIVDDEESVRTALSRLFRSAGFKAVAYATGAEFLDSIPSNLPDCVILDLHLPVRSGLDILREMKMKDLPLATVMITGHDIPGMRERALASGANAYLVKPVDETTLISSVLDCIQGKGK